MDYRRLVLLISFFSLYGPSDIYGCRYTIREIGYADIGSAIHYLYLFTDSGTPEKEITTLKHLSTALLNETNADIRLIHIDKGNSGMETEIITRYDVETFPSAVFQFPDGDHMFFQLTHPGKSLQESFWMVLQELNDSAMRGSIRKKLAGAYCVVLYIEGNEKQQNRLILGEVKKAVSEISRTFDQMPKAVNYPPFLMVLPHKDIPDERLLLTGLGITEKLADEPVVAILYGRGRIMGSALAGPMINRERVFNLLTLVGADCECGLDHSWILGRMIPMRWESGIQADVARNLGFDVENPMVKAEMVQILSLKPVPDDYLDPMGNNLLGYTEGRLHIVNGSERSSRISATAVQRSFFQENTSMNSLVVKVLLFGFGTILLVVILVLLFISNRQRKT